MFKWYTDSLFNRIILTFIVCGGLASYEFGFWDWVLKRSPAISPPPQVMNDGSVRYTLVDERTEIIIPKNPKPTDPISKLLKGREDWVLKLKDIAHCDEKGADGVCKKWEFTSKEPKFLIRPKGGALMWFGLKYPEFVPYPDPNAKGRPLVELDYVEVSISDSRAFPPRYNAETNEHGGLGSSMADTIKTVCRKDVEIVSGLFRLREANEDERLQAEIRGEKFFKNKLDEACLNQNKKKSTGTQIVDGGGQVVMQLPSSSGFAEQRYLYYGPEDNFLSEGYCSLDRKINQENVCYFKLFLPPSKRVNVSFNHVLLKDFPNIYHGVLNFLTQSTEVLEWKAYN